MKSEVNTKRLWGLVTATRDTWNTFIVIDTKSLCFLPSKRNTNQTHIRESRMREKYGGSKREMCHRERDWKKASKKMKEREQCSKIRDNNNTVRWKGDQVTEMKTKKRIIIQREDTENENAGERSKREKVQATLFYSPSGCIQKSCLLALLASVPRRHKGIQEHNDTK